eukprot:1158926-Pelagomonas_calceolata.AAC.6
MATPASQSSSQARIRSFDRSPFEIVPLQLVMWQTLPCIQQSGKKHAQEETASQSDGEKRQPLRLTKATH